MFDLAAAKSAIELVFTLLGVLFVDKLYEDHKKYGGFVTFFNLILLAIVVISYLHIHGMKVGG